MNHVALGISQNSPNIWDQRRRDDTRRPPLGRMALTRTKVATIGPLEEFFGGQDRCLTAVVIPQVPAF